MFAVGSCDCKAHICFCDIQLLNLLEFPQFVLRSPCPRPQPQLYVLQPRLHQMVPWSWFVTELCLHTSSLVFLVLVHSNQWNLITPMFSRSLLSFGGLKLVEIISHVFLQTLEVSIHIFVWLFNLSIHSFYVSYTLSHASYIILRQVTRLGP